jgi:hypothetical protein
VDKVVCLTAQLPARSRQSLFLGIINDERMMTMMVLVVDHPWLNRLDRYPGHLF